MKIFSVSAHKPLKDHIEEIRTLRNPASWRCFCAKLNKELHWDPYAQQIILNFIEENYRDFDVYEFAFYWLKSGHVFLLFQGRVKKAHDTFSRFMDFVSEGEEASRPEFEVYDMGRQIGFVEDFYEEALKEIGEQKKEQNKAFDLQKEKDGEEEEEQKQLEKQRQKDMERSRRLKPLLLLVEDEKMTQSFIEALAEPYCDILVADTIAAGRSLYYKYWPNIVFMDIELPDGSGQNLLEELCKKDPKAYIVMVSANLSSKRVTFCEKAGCKGFVIKPVTSDKQRLLSFIYNYRK